MSDDPAFQKLGFSSRHDEVEQLLTELQSSMDRLQHVELGESAHLVSELQTLIDEIRDELGNVNKH